MFKDQITLIKHSINVNERMLVPNIERTLLEQLVKVLSM